MSNPLELPFDAVSGKAQNPSQSLETATNNHQLMPMLLHWSKPSRWWQPPRVIRTPQPQRSPSATRCDHSSKCTRNHSQSHYDDKSMMEMSGRSLLRLTRISSMSKCQGLFKDPQENPIVTHFGSDRTHPRVRSGASGRTCQPTSKHLVLPI